MTITALPVLGWLQYLETPEDLAAIQSNARALTTGLDGAIYMAGHARRLRADLNGESFISDSSSSDAFLIKIHPNGDKSWTRLLGSTLTDVANALTTGADGSIYVAGFVGESVDGQTHSGQNDAFIAKYGPTGTRDWTRLLGSTSNDVGTALATGTDGSIYMAGYTSDSLDGQIYGGGFKDAFLAKYNTDGSRVWTRLLGASLDAQATALTIGSDGSVYMAGYTVDSFDGQTRLGNHDAFLAKYDTNGTRVWTKLLGSILNDYAYALTTGADGSIYIAGSAAASINGQAYAGGRNDAFLAKYSPDGTNVWTILSGSNSDDSANALTTGKDGAIYVALSGIDGLARFNTDGTKDWALASSYTFNGTALTTGIDGAVYVTTGSNADATLYEWHSVTDITPPTIEITGDKSILKTGETATISFKLSEESTDFVATDLSVAGGILSGFSGSGTAYAATFTPTITSTANGVISVASGKFTDAAGNQNNDGADANNTVTITVDTIRPTIIVSADKTSLKAGETATVSFTLSEPSSNFIQNDVTVSGGTLSNFSGAGASYTATFTPTNNSTANGVVSVAGNTFSDAAGNLNDDGADANNKVTMSVDLVIPTITILSDKPFLGTGETALLTFTLSEPSTDFIDSDITVAGGNLSSFSGSGTSYTATFTPHPRSTADGVISIASGSFSDAFGNFNVDGAELNNTVTIEVETIHPRIAISSNKRFLKAGEVASLTFTLNEVSTDFASSDVTVTGGTLSSFAGSGTSYTATFTPTTQSMNASVSVANGVFSNIDGYLNTDGADEDNMITMTVDKTLPTIAVATTVKSLRAGQTTTLTFTLSEASTDFTAADVSVLGGTLTGFSGSGTHYTAMFTLHSAELSGVVSVASNKFSDAAGNFNMDGAEANNSLTFVDAKLLGTNRNDYGRALATGPDGSIYMAGETEGNLGGQSGAGMRDIFLSKMNPDGTSVWTKLSGTRLIDEATHLAVANDGSVYMSGTSQASLNGAGNSGSYDAYLLKYDANGNMLWTARQGTSTIDRGYSVATDSTGAAYLVGQTNGRLDGQRGSGNFDGFITKYSAQGTKLWTQMIGTSGIDVIKDVVTDASDFVYVTGSVSGTLAGQTRIGGTDAFVTKYTSDGTVAWTKVFGTKLGDVGEAIGLGSDGSIYVAGQTLGSMNGANSGNYDVFLTKFSALGVPQWSRQFGSGKADNALDLVVGTSGIITLTGHLGLSNSQELGLADAYTASFDANGTQTAYEVFGTSSNDYGTAVTEGLGGVIYMAGYTTGSVLMSRMSNGAADAYFFARANQTTLTSASATAAASASPDVFTFAAGSYNATITGGFAYGDKLVFPASMTNLSVSNTSPTDGQILITASGSGQQIQVTLTGVALDLDGAVTNLDSFWATFGPPGT